MITKVCKHFIVISINYFINLFISRMWIFIMILVPEMIPVLQLAAAAASIVAPKYPQFCIIMDSNNTWLLLLSITWFFGGLGEKFQDWKLIGLKCWHTDFCLSNRTTRLNPVKVDHLHTTLHQLNRDTCKVIAFEKERLPYRYYKWDKFHSLLMGPRAGNEADTVSLVRHLTEGNGLHEYFMGFGCTFPHILNLLSC